MSEILIIDDDEQLRLTLSEVVESLGHRVQTASDGREGLSLFSSSRFDCVITDLAMPQVDGLAVLKSVKRARPQTGVLVITGHSTVDLLATSINNGVDGYVTKPFRVRELVEQLQRILGGVDESGRSGEQRFPMVPAAEPSRVGIRLVWGLGLAAALVLCAHLLGGL